MTATMTSNDHAEAWKRHNDDAEAHLRVAEQSGDERTAQLAARVAQAHATLAHTHAYLMVEGLR